MLSKYRIALIGPATLLFMTLDPLVPPWRAVRRSAAGGGHLRAGPHLECVARLGVLRVSGR
jgi:hypothetical protein